jgi:diguanylate cyclase (GGDEF)-like protein
MTKARKREEATEQAVALLGEVAAGYYGGDPSSNPSMRALPPAPPPYIPEPIEHPNLGFTPIELPGGALLPTGEGYDTDDDEEEGSSRRFRRGSRRRRRRARIQAEADAARFDAPEFDPTEGTSDYDARPYEGPSPYEGIAEAIQEVTDDPDFAGPDGVAPIAFEWSADLHHFVEDPPAREVVEEAPFPPFAAHPPVTEPEPQVTALPPVTEPEPQVTAHSPVTEPEPQVTAHPPVTEPEPQVTAHPPVTEPEPQVVPAGEPAGTTAVSEPVVIDERTRPADRVERRQRASAPTSVVAPKSERVERLNRGLDLVFELDQLWTLSARAINQVAPGTSAQLLTADEEGALEQALVAGPDPFHRGCTVPDREMCPAMRLDRVMRFENSEYLDACPFLAIREDGPLSAVCIPFRSQRSQAGVLHTTAPVDAPTSDAHVDELTVALALIGKRNHDITSGSEDSGAEVLESTIDQLVQQETEFAVALVHLDNFRLYNRAHGLDIGDAAVQRFDQVARRVVRPEDLVVGDGGDEFFMVFPNTTAKGAAVVCDRLRSELAASFVDNGVPRFTVSIGVADTDDGATFDELLAVIERAVVHAEAAGHDLVVSTKVIAARREDTVQDLASH